MAEPMGEKSVNALAGIGEVLGKRLEEKGFDKVVLLMSSILLIKSIKICINKETEVKLVMMEFVFHFHFLPLGICCTRTVSGPEERRGVVSGMVEGYVWCKYQTARRLLQLSARVV